MSHQKAITKYVSVYLRVSSEEQGNSGLGLEAQLQLCKQVAANLGLEVTGIYEDVISGKSNPMDREGFKAAINNAQENKGQILIAKLDRLARDVYYISSLVNGYMIKNCPKLIIADNPNASEFEINIRASISQEERKMISERTKAALQIKKQQGYELGKAGRKASVDKANELTKDAIERAKELRNQGLSYENIASILNKEGYTTSRGNNWTKRKVHARLT